MTTKEALAALLNGSETTKSWAERTDLPQATLGVIQNGDTFCRGIVISVAERGATA